MQHHGCRRQYLHFNVILQLGIQEVESNRLLEFRILQERIGKKRETLKGVGLYLGSDIFIVQLNTVLLLRDLF